VDSLQGFIPRHHLHESARADERLAQDGEHSKGFAYALFVFPIQSKNQVRFGNDFVHSLSVFIEAALNGIVGLENGQQTWQRRAAIHQQSADFLIDDGPLGLA
jgi:hypothetical protein